MSSLSEIRNTFNKIAAKHGLSGVSVELAKDLLSQAVYYNKIDKLSIVNSNSVDTTTSINALIQYALTNLYPVYRGKNAVIRLYGVWTNNSINYKRGDVVLSTKNFNLYFDKSYTKFEFEAGVKPIAVNGQFTPILHDGQYIPVNQDGELEADLLDQIVALDLIVAKNFVDNRQFTNKAPYYLEALGDTNVSENVELFAKLSNSHDDQYTRLTFTKYFSEHLNRIQLDDNEGELGSFGVTLPMMLTGYDYSIRLYPGNFDIEDGTDSKFRRLKADYALEQFKFNYFPYYEYNPEYSEIDGLTIEGFQIIKGLYVTNEDGETSFIELNAVKVGDKTEKDFINHFSFTETTDKTEVMANNFRKNFGISLYESVEPEGINSGIPYLIQANIYGAQKLRSTYDLIDTFNKFFEDKVVSSSWEFDNTNTAFPTINIHYIPKNGVIASDKIQEFKDKKAYYFNCEIGKILAAKVKQIDLVINLFLEYNIEIGDIEEAISSYNYKTNCAITLQELTSKINSVPGVKYSSLVVTLIDGSTSVKIDPSVTDPQGLCYIVYNDEIDDPKGNGKSFDQLVKEGDHQAIQNDQYVIMTSRIKKQILK